MFYEGKSYFPKTVKEAQSLGIGFIHQELMLCRSYPSWKHFLGNEKRYFVENGLANDAS